MGEVNTERWKRRGKGKLLDASDLIGELGKGWGSLGMEKEERGG